ncbi:hypothetical protein COE30_15580 [Bacillus cereus]|uniref:anti-sigma factor n=1 Tax=Bacillus cereus TaxID=1396 RepID=UPI000BFE72C5|nr:anti-sigma factor [Bacillus cereus]MDM5236285.1 anti sigma factor C-terminal domain-containing protein [Bacillus cereus]PGZ07858.1 hypothetical protein COE30_15580 [Bacillus cereus]
MSRKDFDLNMDDKQMKALMKKAKRKQFWRNLVISVVVTLVLIIGSISLLIYFNEKSKREMDQRVYLRKSVQGPNIIFNSHTKLSMGIASGTMMYSSYKNIQGQPVKWIDEIYEYSIWGYHQQNYNGNTILDEENQNKKSEFAPVQDYNRQTMQREMRFYLPFVKYLNYVNDLEGISELQNKVAEVALSFDKAYTAEEVVKMLPEGIRPVWFWVDTYNEKKADTYTGLTDPETGAVLNAELSIDVFGFEGSYADKKEDEHEDIKGNSAGFIGSMKSLSENKGGYQEHFRTNYNEVKNFKPKDLPIYGVVVTGKTEDLQSLQGAPYIKAAVRGVTVEKY